MSLEQTEESVFAINCFMICPSVAGILSRAKERNLAAPYGGDLGKSLGMFCVLNRVQGSARLRSIGQTFAVASSLLDRNSLGGLKVILDWMFGSDVCDGQWLTTVRLGSLPLFKGKT
jgi:hypothetical protein